MDNRVGGPDGSRAVPFTVPPQKAGAAKGAAFSEVVKKSGERAGAKEGDAKKKDVAARRDDSGAVPAHALHSQALQEALLRQTGGEPGGEGGRGGEGGEGEGGAAAALAAAGEAAAAKEAASQKGTGAKEFAGKLGKLEAGAGAEGPKGLSPAKGAKPHAAAEKAGGEKAGGVEAKGEAAKLDAAKADAAKDAQKAAGPHKEGPAVEEKPKSGKGEDLKTEVAKNLAPGVGPHPFVLQGPQQAAPAQPVHKVQIPPEIVDKIVERARFGMNAEGAHEFQIDLKQDVFRGLKLSVATRDGKVEIKMIAASPEVQKAFEGKAQELAQALSAKGLDVQNVVVTTAQAEQQRAFQQGDQGGGGRKQGGEERSVGGVGGVRRSGAAARASNPGLDSGPESGKDYTA